MNFNDLQTKEKIRLAEIDMKLAKYKHTFDGFLPIFQSIDHKIKSIQIEIKELEDEKAKLTQGQLIFDNQF